jgi:alkylation response protein AidB-like acyl-CoA dehydrogenase
MDLEFTEEQDMFRGSIRDFFTKYDRNYVKACDDAKAPPVEAFREMGQIGWLGINTPLEYGGSAGSTIDMAILLEEIGRGFLDLALWTFRVVSHGSHAMQAHGTTEQKERFLPLIARGELSPSFALSEPEAGSDAASLTTAAKAVDGGFRVSGQKIYCSGFKVSDYVLTATRTSSPERKHEGITTLFIPSDSPGLTATPIETLGHWPLGTTALFFDDVEVSDEYRIGPVDGGWPLLTDMLEYERLCLSAARIGAAQAALEETVAYVKGRTQFGRPVSKFQGVSHKLADMQVLVDTGRMLVYRYAYRLDRGTATTRDAATVKLFCGEAYKAVSDMGLQALGGYGYTMESGLQRHFRESRLGTIGGGTSEIQRNIIAKTMGL